MMKDGEDGREATTLGLAVAEPTEDDSETGPAPAIMPAGARRRDYASTCAHFTHTRIYALFTATLRRKRRRAGILLL
ncbi:unnamed protein product [Peniophora sp. CBMAI 1063]|nr:unnamed protein product [Peniophora sp. CBMAI 1063]